MSTPKRNGYASRGMPPASTDAERNVLACIILDNSTIADPAVANLPAHAFTDRDFQIVRRHALGLHLEGKPIDAELLSARICAHGEIPDAKQRCVLLKSIIESQVNAAHVRHFAEILAETARLREHWEHAHKILEQVGDRLPADDIDGMISQFSTTRTTNKQESPTMRSMQQKNTSLRPPIVHGLLREGETLNIIAPPKVGKSWLATDLALSVVTGRPWLGKFVCERGPVLIVDNELHAETSTFRIPKVGEALGIPFDDYADDLRIENVRGRMMTIHDLGVFLQRYQPGQFKAVVLDAFYKFLPPGVDENSNPDMARMYATIDSYAARLRCAFVLIHHSTKGNQSGKAVTDVGAGAGAQSRATDTHMVLRQHAEDGVYVVDGVTRSFQPFDPFCLRWEFPIWTPASECDPAELRRERKPTKETPPKPAAMSAAEFVERFVTAEPRRRDAIINAAIAAGVSARKAASLLNTAKDIDLIYQWNMSGTAARSFATVPQGQDAHV